MKRLFMWVGIFMSMFLVAIPASGENEEVTRLTFEHTNGTQTLFNLTESPIMTFDGENLRIQTSTVDTSVLRSEVSYFHFTKGPSAGIDNVIADESYSVSYIGNVLTVSGSGVKTLTVYNVDGKQVATYTGDESGVVVADMGKLPANVYVVAIPGKPSMKVIVR